MFTRKKPPKEPDYSKMPVLPNKLSMFVQAKYGLTPDELLKLFESLERVNEKIKVARRKPVEGKDYSRLVGGRKKFMTIAEAVEYERKRIENRFEKEEKIRELVEDVNFNELMGRLEVNDSVYPKRLSPSDIVVSLASASEKLEGLDRKPTTARRVDAPREEVVLDALERIKQQAPLRLLRRMADRQRSYALDHTMEELEAEYAAWLRKLKGEPEPDTEEERLIREELERLAAEAAATEENRIAAEEAARNFADLSDVHTLLDDVAAIIRQNPDSAAAIVRQWIGNAVLIEKGS